MARALKGLPVRWWIAGGWALDLFLGSQRREHEDVDVLLLRADAPAAQRHLRGWHLFLASHDEGVRPWVAGEEVPASVGDIWVRETADGPWRFEFMLNPAEGDHWVFKRDPELRLPLDEIGGRTPDGIPYLRPEIQLLHKATGSLGIRPKDEDDFAVVLPHLDPGRRAWLSGAISRVRPDHPWLGSLGTS